MIGLVKGWIAPVAFLIVLSALGFQTYRVEGLQGDLELARTNAANFLQTANQNAAVLERLKSDYNGSLNACYGDIKNLADRFDNYREAVAAKDAKRPLASNRAERGKQARVPRAELLVNAPREQRDTTGALLPREVQSEIAAPLPAPQTITCEIGGANPMVDALNNLNKEGGDER
jgi:hypothetical protein